MEETVQFFMPDWSAIVPDLVVVLVLWSLSGFLLARRRWETQNALLASFLLLVGVGFLADALSLATGTLAWGQVDLLASAFDPLLLLAFVTEHPYVRRTRLHRLALAWLAVAGAACATVVLLAPGSILASQAAPAAPARLLLLGGVVALGYTLAWFASVGSLRHAPTVGLARRARWSCLAVGVAVVPRVPHAPLVELRPLPLGPGLEAQLVLLAGMLGLVAALVLPALVLLRGAREAQAARRVVASVGWIASALLVVYVALPLASITFNHPFAMRWIVFSVLLVYAVLAHQVLRFPSSTRRLLPILGSVVVGLVAMSILLSFLAGSPLGTATAIALGVVVGVGAAMPGALAARALVDWAERMPGANDRPERRLALYSAAVEAALAGGTPERLPRARRHLGLSREEARVVEDLVRRSLAPPQLQLRPGDEPLPGVVLDRLLPGGSQGRTFLARQLPEGRRAIVKQLSASTDAAARRRLWKELDALRTLHHPRLPRLLGFTLDPICVAYEHIAGRTLAAALRDGPLQEARLRVLAGDLLEALQAVHEAGFVHGDVKPSNIILGNDGRASLIDFGLAELRPNPRATLAADGASPLAGTLDYLPPELAKGVRASPASDAFSLGLVVLEAATGRPARQLRGLAVYQALDRLAREEVQVERGPPRWQAFLRGALHPDPRKRLPLSALRELVPRQAPKRARRLAAAATP